MMSEKDFWQGYVPEPTYTFKPTSELPITLLEMKPNYNMTFNRDGKQIGVLDFNGPEMVFTGDADESAKVFFDFIARSFKGRLEQERADEREACAKFCETNQVWVGQGKRGFSEWGEEEFVTGGRHQGMDYADAIRARSNI